MTQRVRKPHRGTNPSSVTQLPILTALHAGLPTLFVAIIHEKGRKVNCFFQIQVKIILEKGLTRGCLCGKIRR